MLNFQRVILPTLGYTSIFSMPKSDCLAGASIISSANIPMFFASPGLLVYTIVFLLLKSFEYPLNHPKLENS